MDELNDRTVGELDIRLQLKKMLATERFQTKEVRALLLQYVVEQTLAGEVLSQEKIGKALFPGFEPGIHDDVRVNATYLRQDLLEYYSEEGKEDLVRIEIQKRYKVIFSYNPRSEVIALYRLGLYHVSLLTEDDMETAVRRFKKVLELKSDFAPAYVAHAEALLCYEVLYTLIRESRIRFLHSSKACELVNRALEIDPQNWEAHVVLGAVYCTQWDWERASNSFDKAMSLNLVGVTTNFWYAMFLLAIGNQQKALRVAETIARHAPDNLNAQLMFALFLYAARQHERAMEASGAAGRMNQRHWAPCFLFALNELALGKPDDAGLEFRETSLIIGDINDQPVFPGFTLFTDLHEGDFKQASYSYSLFKEKKNPSAIDTVMFYMAKEMDDDAVKELDSLRAQPCPIICWLHLWPLFDLLRENPNFKRLIADMNLPSGHS